MSKITTRGSQASDTYTLLAAVELRRMSVVTDHGLVTGYLLGLDADRLVLYALFARGDVQYWTPVVLPRAFPLFLESATIAEEDEVVRDEYRRQAGPFIEQLLELFKKAKEKA